ncbi:MAG: CPBP family intramembrane metalloprotease [Clostridia bacterium]|nr:CPBP family intramembrane metalloprotease [Clostridia bacterium]
MIKKTKIGITDIRKYKEKPLTQITVAIVITAVTLGCYALKTLIDGTEIRVWTFLDYSLADAAELVLLQLLYSVTEELFMRCWLLRFTEHISSSKWIGVFVSSLLFGLAHWIFGGSFEKFAYLSVIGLVWGISLVKVKGCTIYSLILSHFLYDLAVAS